MNFYHFGGKQVEELIEHLLYAMYSAKNIYIIHIYYMHTHTIAFQFLITIIWSNIIWGVGATWPH